MSTSWKESLPIRFSTDVAGDEHHRGGVVIGGGNAGGQVGGTGAGGGEAYSHLSGGPGIAVGGVGGALLVGWSGYGGSCPYSREARIRRRRSGSCRRGSRIPYLPPAPADIPSQSGTLSSTFGSLPPYKLFPRTLPGNKNKHGHRPDRTKPCSVVPPTFTGQSVLHTHCPITVGAVPAY